MRKQREQKINGVNYLVVDAELEKGCKGCVFIHAENCPYKNKCMAHKRNDKRSVIFLPIK